MSPPLRELSKILADHPFEASLAKIAMFWPAIHPGFS